MNNVENKKNAFSPVREEMRCTFKSGSLSINVSKLRIEGRK